MVAGSTGAAEPEARQPVPGPVPVPVRRAHAPGPIPERAAPKHPIAVDRRVVRACWVYLCRASFRPCIGSIPVGHPFPCVPVHIIQAERVGELAGHLVNIEAGAFEGPRSALEIPLVVAEGEPGCAPRPGGILPLRFG